MNYIDHTENKDTVEKQLRDLSQLINENHGNGLYQPGEMITEDFRTCLEALKSLQENGSVSEDEAETLNELIDKHTEIKNSSS